MMYKYMFNIAEACPTSHGETKFRFLFRIEDVYVEEDAIEKLKILLEKFPQPNYAITVYKQEIYLVDITATLLSHVMDNEE